MKKCFLIIILVLAVCSLVLPCMAYDVVDPILLNEPNEKVFGCKNDIYIEILQKEIISKVASGRTATEYFILFPVEVLFLVDDTWEGIDRTSFSLKLTDQDGNETFYPLNYAISMMSNQKVHWPLFSKPLKFTDLRLTNLVFNVPYVLDGWTLVFRPTARGASAPYCEIDVPLNLR